jgi:2-dehydropantoate 2-reductase
MKWSKMITNLISNASSAILDMTPEEIFSHPGLYRMENMQIQEALSVMQALNIKPINLPGTPVRLLVFTIRQLPLIISRLILKKAVGGGRGSKMPSFHIDLHSGRKKSEVDFLNGAVVRTARKLQIDTPINFQLNQILLGLTAGEIPIDTYRRQPEKLLSEITHHL